VRTGKGRSVRKTLGATNRVRKGKDVFTEHEPDRNRVINEIQFVLAERRWGGNRQVCREIFLNPRGVHGYCYFNENTNPNVGGGRASVHKTRDDFDSYGPNLYMNPQKKTQVIGSPTLKRGKTRVLKLLGRRLGSTRVQLAAGWEVLSG